MGLILKSSQLGGMPLERAELYGKPHLGCRYTSGDRYEALQPVCAVCGRRAGSCHHVARRSWGKAFRLETENGTWDLRSPLFALCGSGTTGCHGRFHTAGLRAEWRWRSDEYGEAWWRGELLRDYGPHHPGLYGYGCWVVTDGAGHEMIREER